MSSIATTPRSRAFRVLRGANEVPRPEWDALARRGYHRHAWFVANESCGAEARHVAVYEDSTLVAVVPAYLERETLHGDLHARWYGPLTGIAAGIGAGLRPSLAIGAPLSTGSDPLGADDVLTAPLLDGALALLETEARSANAKAIVWPFVSDRHATARAVARRRGYVESFAGSQAVVDVEWSSADAYLESRSKNVRRTLRQELAWVREQGIRVTWERDLAALGPELDALYRKSFATRNKHAPALSPSFFAELGSQRSPGVRVQCARRGSKLLEMALALDGGGALDLCLSAQGDQARNGLLYQHCLCYDPVRAAIADGLARIYLGPSALYPKALRGARLERRVTLVRGCTAPARAAIRVLAPMVAARNGAKERRALAALAAQ